MNMGISNPMLMPPLFPLPPQLQLTTIGTSPLIQQQFQFQQPTLPPPPQQQPNSTAASPIPTESTTVSEQIQPTVQQPQEQQREQEQEAVQDQEDREPRGQRPVPMVEDNEAQPQRLIDEPVAQQDQDNRYLNIFIRAAVLSFILFSRKGIFKCIQFAVIFVLIYYAVQIFSRWTARRQQQARVSYARQQLQQHTQQEEEEIEEEESVQRGVFGTLFHIIYLFFYSLLPSYQPQVIGRRRVHEHQE
jgi:Ca2+-dependent lipid-binding protein